MAVNPITYVKNVGKSFGYIALDTLGSSSPVMKDMIDSNKDTISSLYSEIKNFSSSPMDKIRNNQKIMSYSNDIKTGFQNLASDLKTGTFYNAARQNDAMNAAMGIDFDFDSMFDDIDLDFDEKSLNSDTKAAAAIADGSTKEILAMDVVGSRVATAVGTATAKSAEYIVNANAESTRAVLNQNSKIFSAISTGMIGINKTLGDIVKLSQPLTEHMQNSVTFYTKSTENQLKMIELLERIDKNTKMPEPKKGSGSKRYSGIEDYLGAGFGLDLGKLSGKVKGNFKNAFESTTFGMLLSMNDMFGEGMMTKMFASNPLGMIMPMVLEGAIMTPKLKKSLNQLSDALGAASLKMMRDLRKQKNSSNPIMAFIGELFGYDSGVGQRKYTGEYEKGPVPFDGVTRQAIVKVIPEYLSMILKAVSGSDQTYYDYKNGKFTTASQIRAKKEADEMYTVDKLGVDTKLGARSFAESRKAKEETIKDLERAVDEYVKNAIAKGDNYYIYADSNVAMMRDRCKEYGFSTKHRFDLFVKYVVQARGKDNQFGLEYLNARINSERISRGNNPYDEFDVESYLEDSSLFTASRTGGTRSRESRTKGTKKGSSKGGSSDEGGPSEQLNATIVRQRLKAAGYDVNSSTYKNLTKEFDSYDKMTDGEKEKYIEKLGKYTDKSSSASSKSQVKVTEVLNSVQKFFDAPLSAVANMIDKGSTAIYNLLYGKEGEEGEKSILGHIFKNMKDMFTQFKDWTKKEIFDPIKEYISERGGIKRMFMEFLGIDEGFDEWKRKFKEKASQVTKDVGTKFRSAGRWAWENSPVVQAGRNFRARRRQAQAASEWEESMYSNYMPEGSGSGLRGGASTTENAAGFGREVYNETMNGVKRFISAIFPDKKDLDKDFGKIGEVSKKALNELKLDPSGAITGALIGTGVSILTGGIVGPFLAAAIGGAAGLTINSETVQKALFGEDVVDDEGNTTHKAGLLGDKLTKFLTQDIKKMGAYGATGAVLSMIPGIPGGPLTGILVGSALGFANREGKLSNYLFGEMANGERQGGVISKEVQDKIKKLLPKAAAGSILGLIAGPFGLVPNLIVGAGLGFASETEQFKRVLYGEEVDEIGPDGKPTGEKTRKGGIAGWIRESIAKPITSAIRPIADELKHKGAKLLHSLGDKIANIFKVHVGIPLRRRLGVLLGPLNKVFGRLGKMVGGVVSAPFKMIGRIGNEAKFRQVLEGRGSMSAQERQEIRQSAEYQEWAARKHPTRDANAFSAMDASMAQMNVDELNRLKNDILDVRKRSRQAVNTANKSMNKIIDMICIEYSKNTTMHAGNKVGSAFAKAYKADPQGGWSRAKIADTLQAITGSIPSNEFLNSLEPYITQYEIDAESAFSSDNTNVQKALTDLKNRLKAAGLNENEINKINERNAWEYIERIDTEIWNRGNGTEAVGAQDPVAKAVESSTSKIGDWFKATINVLIRGFHLDNSLGTFDFGTDSNSFDFGSWFRGAESETAPNGAGSRLDNWYRGSGFLGKAFTTAKNWIAGKVTGTTGTQEGGLLDSLTGNASNDKSNDIESTAETAERDLNRINKEKFNPTQYFKSTGTTKEDREKFRADQMRLNIFREGNFTSNQISRKLDVIIGSLFGAGGSFGAGGIFGRGGAFSSLLKSLGMIGIGVGSAYGLISGKFDKVLEGLDGSVDVSNSEAGSNQTSNITAVHNDSGEAVNIATKHGNPQDYVDEEGNAYWVGTDGKLYSKDEYSISDNGARGFSDKIPGQIARSLVQGRWNGLTASRKLTVGGIGKFLDIFKKNKGTGQRLNSFIDDLLYTKPKNLINSALDNTAPVQKLKQLLGKESVEEAVGSAAVSNVDNAIEAVEKQALGNTDNIINFAEKKALKEATGSTAAKSSTMLTEAVEAAESSATKLAAQADDVVKTNFITRVYDAVKGFFKNLRGNNYANQVLTPGAIDEIGEATANEVAKVAESAASSKGVFKSIKHNLETTPVAGWVVATAFALYDFEEGWNRAERIWQVSDPTIVERLICGVFAAIPDVISVACGWAGFVAAIGQEALLKTLINIITPLLKKLGVPVDRLEERRNQALQDLASYNADQRAKNSNWVDATWDQYVVTSTKLGGLGRTTWSEKTAGAVKTGLINFSESDRKARENNTGAYSLTEEDFLTGFGSGLRGGSFVSQIDPNVSTKRFGSSTIGANGCAPSVAAMLTGTSLTDAADYALRRGYTNQYGTSADYFGNVLNSAGIPNEYVYTGAGSAQDYLASRIAGGSPTVLLGQDPYNTSKAYSPFGPNNHYVLATGMTNDGGVIVQDPESSTPNNVYDSSILNNVKLGIPTGGRSGLLRRLVRRIRGGESGTRDMSYEAQQNAMKAASAPSTYGHRDMSVDAQQNAMKVANAPAKSRDMSWSAQQSAMNKTLGTSVNNQFDATTLANNVSSYNGSLSLDHQQIWTYLKRKGLTEEGAAALMGCWEKESGNHPNRIEGDYMKSFPGFEAVAASKEAMDRYVQAVLWPAIKKTTINKKAYQGSDGHYYPGFGLAQWTGPRTERLLEFARSRGLDWKSLGCQLDFAWSELTGSYSSVLSALKAGGDLYELTKLVFNKYEGCSKPDWCLERQKAAASIYSEFTGKTFGMPSYVSSADGSTNTSTNVTEKSGAEKKTTTSSILDFGTMFGKLIAARFGKLGKLFGLNYEDESETEGYGETSEYVDSGNSSWRDIVNATAGDPNELQLALVDKMDSIKGTLKYSMTGPRDPDQGSADCSSTVNWAYQNVLGDSIGNSTPAIMQASNMSTIDMSDMPESGGTGSGPDLSRLMPGDLVLLSRPTSDFTIGRPYRVGHVEMYMGDGKTIGHGSNGGPKIRDIETSRYIMARRYNDFINNTMGGTRDYSANAEYIARMGATPTSASVTIPKTSTASTTRDMSANAEYLARNGLSPSTTSKKTYTSTLDVIRDNTKLNDSAYSEVTTSNIAMNSANTDYRDSNSFVSMVNNAPAYTGRTTLTNAMSGSGSGLVYNIAQDGINTVNRRHKASRSAFGGSSGLVNLSKYSSSRKSKYYNDLRKLRGSGMIDDAADKELMISLIKAIISLLSNVSANSDKIGQIANALGSLAAKSGNNGLAGSGLDTLSNNLGIQDTDTTIREMQQLLNNLASGQ